MSLPWEADFWPKNFAEWRVIPRLLVTLYGWVCYDTHLWFKALSTPNDAQQLYAIAIWGAAAVWFGFYVNSGPNHPNA